MKIKFPLIETKFHRALRLDDDLHKTISDYLKKTKRDFIMLRDGLFISCEFYTVDDILYKIFIVKINDNPPNIIKMGNVLLFSEKGFTILPKQAFDTLFKVEIEQ